MAEAAGEDKGSDFLSTQEEKRAFQCATKASFRGARARSLASEARQAAGKVFAAYKGQTGPGPGLAWYRTSISSFSRAREGWKEEQSRKRHRLRQEKRTPPSLFLRPAKSRPPTPPWPSPTPGGSFFPPLRPILVFAACWSVENLPPPPFSAIYVYSGGAGAALKHLE